MSAWPTSTLSELCEINIGRTPSRNESTYWGVGHPWLSISDMKQGRRLASTKEQITPLAADSVMASRVEANTVALSFKLSIGKVGITSIPMYTNEAIATLPIRDPRKISTDFLYWALRSVDLTGDSDDAVMGKTLNKQKLARVAIPVPPPRAQREIVEVLDRVDELRAKRRQSIALLDDLAQSIFLDMFGVLGDSKFDAHKPLSEITAVINDCPHSTPKWTESGKVCLRTSNLGIGRWIWSETRFVSDETFHDRSSRGYLEPGDIVLSREGTVGVAATVESGLELCMGQRLVQVRPLRGITNSAYLQFYLLKILAPERIGQYMAGSTSKHLNLRDLRKLAVPVPPIAVQDSFASSVAKVSDARARSMAQLHELDVLFSSLQSRAFKGELWNDNPNHQEGE
ncbi:restriction endonuclease subunit S [Nocardia sp. NPDC060249]|uniref:restriction endonuclease subunit S n=1 Tax=Nocardia sp. NPDC060249 TaxID=3347082 RepID=UPI003653197C